MKKLLSPNIVVNAVEQSQDVRVYGLELVGNLRDIIKYRTKPFEECVIQEILR